MRRISNFQWVLILAACALAVFIVGTISLYIRLNLPDLLPKDFNDSAFSWAFWSYWAIHIPLIILLSRRFPFERRHLAKALLIQLAAGTIWAMIVQGLPLLLVPVLNESVGYGSRLFFNWAFDWASMLVPNILFYWLVLSINLIFMYYERYQKEMLKASKLDAQLSNARLQTLKMQLHPHFLFNTLHSISALVLKNENRDAVKMINRLSELLRLTLDNLETQSFTLENEIEFTRRYLEIERIRFHDRLAVEWDVEPPALAAEVPTLILQPLVENAMRHGVDSNPGASRIQIAARLQDGRLLIEVRDDGKEPEKIAGQNGAAGLGLKNTRARLAELYGEDHGFSLSRRENEWTVARIVLPFSAAQDRAKGEPR